MNERLRVLFVVSLLPAVASALVRSYALDPKTAAMSGWTSWKAPNNRVSQVITCNFDSVVYCELFVGAKGAGGVYTAIILQDNAELTRSPGDKVPDHGWVRFENWNNQVGFTKGRQYEFRFTRAGADSIQYYYQRGRPLQVRADDCSGTAATHPS